MVKSPKLCAKILREAADRIELGKCGLDDDELRAMATMFAHRKLNIEQTCQHFGISRATLNRWQQSGKLPEFKKDSGGKDYLWMDEAEETVERWEEEHKERR